MFSFTGKMLNLQEKKKIGKKPQLLLQFLLFPCVFGYRDRNILLSRLISAFFSFFFFFFVFCIRDKKH